jgi:Bacterial archaeo-eukaryotic release factor family 11
MLHLGIPTRADIKPLLRVVTVPQSAFVLALTPDSVRTVEVSPDVPAAAFKVDGMPKSAASAAGRPSIKEPSPGGRIQGDEGIRCAAPNTPARRTRRCANSWPGA